jgi:hypothetical protein
MLVKKQPRWRGDADGGDGTDVDLLRARPAAAGGSGRNGRFDRLTRLAAAESISAVDSLSAARLATCFARRSAAGRGCLADADRSTAL